MSVCVCAALPPAGVASYPAEDGQANVHPGPEPGAQVGRAGEDVSQTLVPHELPASLLNQLLHLKVSNKPSRNREKHIHNNRRHICNSWATLGEDGRSGANLLKSPAEPFKHSLHVSSLLHGYDPGVILLVYPDEEILLVVVPVAARRGERWRTC